jgi:hypothetical protein
MNILGDLKNKIVSLLHQKSFYTNLLFFGVIFAMFMINGLHESYPDEFDNILGGWYILHGNPLYTTYFTHHGPTAYFLAAFVEIFSGNSFFRFRMIYSVFLFVYCLFIYWYFRKSLGAKIAGFYPLFLIFVGIGATYFWGHMLLADNISGFFIAPAVGLLIIKRLYRKAIFAGDMILISLLSFFSILCSLTYLYLVFFLYLFLLIEFFQSNSLSFLKLKNYLKPIAILGLPYIVFLIYLLATGSLGGYLYQNFTFNQKYYIYNYPRAPGETFINPVRFAVVIAKNFLTSFSELLIQVKDFNFNFPFNISLAVANTAFLIYLFVKKEYKLILFFLLMLIYANGRSSPLNSSERDYQSAVYILISLFTTCFIIYQLYEELRKNEEYRTTAIYTALLFLIFIYGFENFNFLGRKFMEKAYDKYMGYAPLIYDRPQIAPIINKLVSKDEYTWIGPFEFEEIFYTKGKIASRYQIFNSAMGRSIQDKKNMIENIEKNKPKVIWFDKKFFILGVSPEMYGKEFIAYLDEHYITLLNYVDGKKKYKAVNFDPRTDIETKLYIRNENKDEIISKMLKFDLISETPVQ